jgi:hypothetical protein
MDEGCYERVRRDADSDKTGCTRVCMLQMPTSAQVAACAVTDAPTTPQGYVLNPYTFNR